jgi:type IV secretory pathway VirB2 component (pilin)
MHAFQPLINLLMLLSALSVAAERIANVVKLGHPDLKHPQRRGSRKREKERERRIAKRVLAVSVLIAVAVKADFFALLSGADAPWDTLGWSRSAVRSLPDLVTTIAGTAVTGLALSFGSKFWHDALDLVYGIRTAVSGAAKASRSSAAATKTAT